MEAKAQKGMKEEGRSSLVVIDGEMKSLTSDFIEQVGDSFEMILRVVCTFFYQDGMLVEQQSIRSLDLSELDLEAAKEEKEDEDEEDDGEDEEDEGKESRSALRRRMMVDDNPYNRFLDIMEIF